MSDKVRIDSVLAMYYLIHVVLYCFIALFCFISLFHAQPLLFVLRFPVDVDCILTKYSTVVYMSDKVRVSSVFAMHYLIHVLLYCFIALFTLIHSFLFRPLFRTTPKYSARVFHSTVEYMSDKTRIISVCVCYALLVRRVYSLRRVSKSVWSNPEFLSHVSANQRAPIWSSSGSHCLNQSEVLRSHLTPGFSQQSVSSPVGSPELLSQSSFQPISDCQ